MVLLWRLPWSLLGLNSLAFRGERDPPVQRSGPALAATARPDPNRRRRPLDDIADADVFLAHEARKPNTPRAVRSLVRAGSRLGHEHAPSTAVAASCW